LDVHPRLNWHETTLWFHDDEDNADDDDDCALTKVKNYKKGGLDVPLLSASSSNGSKD